MGIFKDSITSDQLHHLIGTPACPVIIDVRRKKAFDESDRMITTAVWRAHDRAAEWADGLPDGTVVVYCVHGHEVSQGSAKALRSAGVDAVFLEGGIEAFIEMGGETVAK